MDKKTIAVAKFFGFQDTNLGWFDSEGVLSQLYTDTNTFDKLLFNVDFNWIMVLISLVEDTELYSEYLDETRGIATGDFHITTNIQENLDEIYHFTEWCVMKEKDYLDLIE